MKICYMAITALVFGVIQLLAQPKVQVEVTYKYRPESLDASQIMKFELRKDNGGAIIRMGPEALYDGWMKGLVVISPRKINDAEAEDLCFGYTYDRGLKYNFEIGSEKFDAYPYLYVYIMVRDEFFPGKELEDRFTFKLRKFKLSGLIRLRLFQTNFENSAIVNN